MVSLPCQPLENGGLNFINFEIMVKSLRLAWIARLIGNSDDNWKAIPNFYFDTKLYKMRSSKVERRKVVKSDQRLLVMNGSVENLKPIGERWIIIIPDNHLSRNENLMDRPFSLGGMCAGAEERKEFSLPHLLKKFCCEPTLSPCSRELRLNTIVTEQAMLS